MSQLFLYSLVADFANTDLNENVLDENSALTVIEREMLLGNLDVRSPPR
jgi:hypothetical protein